MAELIESLLDKLDTLYLLDFDKKFITITELQEKTRSVINQFKKEIEKSRCEKCKYSFEDKDKPTPYHDVEKYYSTE